MISKSTASQKLYQTINIISTLCPGQETKEDSKANARVVEIFANHRNAWQAEEKWLLHQIDAANQEIAHLNARIAEFEKVEDSSKNQMDQLEKEIVERDEMIGFMSRRGGAEFEDRTEVNLGDKQYS